ncbi:MAG TPA: ABC transporter ATP-binding protein/permease [Methylovirgula sp.]|nr:ABC transporter ATP-binding protein/permease [Methylovirgula sp.]
MKILSLLIALFTAAVAVLAERTGNATLWFFTCVSAICAFTTFQSRGVSSYLRIFVAVFGIELITFGPLALLAAMRLWPKSLASYELPITLPLTVAIFGILVYLVSFIPLVRSMMRIADRFFNTGDRTTARIWPFPPFRGTERGVAIAMAVFLVLINQAEVGINVRISFFSRDWFNAIQNRDAAAFWNQLFFVFAPWVFVYIAAAVTEFFVTSTLVIRWRRWLTSFYVDRWLDNHAHYRMSLAGISTDNPDQRISEDINRFIDGGQISYGVYSFSILLLSKLTSFVSFSIILWTLSESFTLPYTHIAVPGFLCWVAIVYAGLGTLITHWIGRPLARLSFIRQRYEADFRFSLARLREYAEQVALLRGETVEKMSLRQRFAAIVKNYFEIVHCRKKLTAFTASYAQLSPFIPYIVSAPFYFAGKISLGIMTQTANAFSNVNDALTFFVTYYVELADFKSVLDRLTSFDRAIEKAGTFELRPRPASLDEGVNVDALTLRLPDGRTIVEGANLRLASHEPTLFTGPSGSGKSTLFRAIAGIWPYGEGNVELPERVMLLPQKPYIPIGTLRTALAYPASPDTYDDATLQGALSAANLNHLIGKLDVEDIWSQTLSGGEQQRLAVARALLAKPDWLFLDEATTAMDEPMEAEIYKTIREHLPGTTFVSIGHRSSVAQFHKRNLEMRPAGTGMFTPRDMKQAAE